MMTHLNDKKKLRASTWFGIVVMLCWAVTMAALLKDYSGEPEVPVVDGEHQFFDSVKAAEKWQDIDEWMELVHVDSENGKTVAVGASHTSIRHIERATSASAYLAQFALSAKISPLMPAGRIAGTALLDKDGSLTSFTAVAEIAGFNLSTQGMIYQGKLYVKISKPNGVSRLVKTLSRKVTFGEFLRPSIARHMNLLPGEKMSSPIIDPLSGKSRGNIVLTVQKQETIRLNGVSVKAYRVKTSVGDVETLMWVDEDGRTLRRNLVNNLRMDRTNSKRALEIAPGLEKTPDLKPLSLDEFRDVPVDVQPAADEKPNATAGLLDLILK